MAAPTNTLTSLLTEHFTYTPLSLIDDTINSVNALLYKSVSALEQFLLSDSLDHLVTAQELTEEEVSQGVHAWETLLENTVDRNFDKFELYTLRNVFSIPPELEGWIRLEHHKDLEFDGDSEDLDEQIAQARKQLTNAIRFQRILKSSQSITESQLQNLQSHAENLSFLKSSPAESTSFLVSQIKALKGLLEAVAAREDEVRRIKVDERDVYIETGVKRAVDADGEGDEVDWDAEKAQIGDLKSAKRVAELVG